MAISLLLGRPGSGKSYEAVAHYILPALESRHVVTNMPLNVDVFERYNSAFKGKIHLVKDRPDIPAFSRLDDYRLNQGYQDSVTGERPLFVIDEAHKSIPSGGTPRAVLEWYAEHRHAGVDVLLVTQDSRKIHRAVQSLVEDVSVLSKNHVLGSSKSYRRRVKDGVGGAYIGDASVRVYNKKFFPFYVSYTQGAEGESAFVKRMNIFKRPIFLFLAFLFFGSLYLMLRPLWSDVPLSKAIVGEPKKAVSEKSIYRSDYVDKPSVPAVGVRPSSSHSSPPFFVTEARLVFSASVGDNASRFVNIRDGNFDDRRVSFEELESGGWKAKEYSSGYRFTHSSGATFFASYGRMPPLPFNEQYRRSTMRVDPRVPTEADFRAQLPFKGGEGVKTPSHSQVPDVPRSSNLESGKMK